MKKLSFLITLFLLVLPTLAFAVTTVQKISEDGNGGQGNSHSYSSTMTPDGRYVVFYSVATNLVAGDTNGQGDLFIKDTISNTISRVNVASNGAEANGTTIYNRDTQITPDGRYVVFLSNATNLVAGDTNGSTDVFVRDTVNNTTIRASVANNGNQGDYGADTAKITPDGRYVVFESYSDNLVANDTHFDGADLFVRDTVNNTTMRVNIATNGSEADGYDSSFVTITADGRYVVFNSDATNLVPSDTNSSYDVFVRDTVNNTTMRVSIRTDGSQGNGGSYAYSQGDISSNSTTSVITPDGKYIVFQSDADNLVAGDTNGSTDVFVRDTINNTTTRVSVAHDGEESRDNAYAHTITPDGKYILFVSPAGNLVPNDNGITTDLFLRDIINNTIERVTVSKDGGTPSQSLEFRQKSKMSSNGKYILFLSRANNIVPGDTNTARDLFLRDTINNITRRVSVGNQHEQGNGLMGQGPFHVSLDGTKSLFDSYAGNLFSGDTNGSFDVFIKKTLPIYNSSGHIYVFNFPDGLQYKNITNRGSFTTILTTSGSTYSSLNPFITISKGVESRTVAQIINSVTQQYQRLFRNQMTVTNQIEHLINGSPVKQLHFSGTIGGKQKIYIVTFIRNGSDVYVVSASGNGLFPALLDEIVDYIISTWSFNASGGGGDIVVG